MSKLSEYDIGRTVGEGAYGIVHLARKRTQPRVRLVLKCLAREKRQSYTQEVAAYTLLQATTLGHPHIVRFFEGFETPSRLILVLEYVAGGDLHTYCQAHTMVVEQIRHTLKQVLEAVQFCHTQGLIVTDLKSENVLLVDTTPFFFTIKLCDFGMSKTTSENEGVYGTLDYVAPETLLTFQHTFSTDAWQTGILGYEMFTNMCPFEAEGTHATEQRILKDPVTFPATIPATAQDLLQALLRKTPTERLTIMDALQHPFWLEQEVDSSVSG